MTTSPFFSPALRNPKDNLLTHCSNCAGESEILVSLESIHNGVVDGLSVGGNKYVKISTLGISNGGNGDVNGILSLVFQSFKRA